MQLAPGIFIANEGGEGHAEQVFLRGFNAETGQAIEFSVGGVPINEVDNSDGHGYADTHFIIPEVVRSLDVTEGPFDPHQGDFAVAGSARYELGVRDRGLRLEAWTGSFSTRRLLALWAPRGEREGTFAAAQFFTSQGFGVSRASSNASAMAQYEGELGQSGLWRVLATTYATHYKAAGVVRRDDVDSGRLDFFGTEDPSQGGDAQRHTLSLDVETPAGDGVATQQVFLTLRSLRIVENFTGFLLDNQEQGQSIHFQRGDAVQKDYSAVTAGARGSYRIRARLLDRDQAIEAGYFARFDHTTPMLQRLRFGTQIPYRIDSDFVTDVVNLAGYVDLDLRPLPWLTLRGGVRQEYFGYDVNDQCQTAGEFVRNAPLDLSCPRFDRSGVRESSRRITATGDLLEPKATALVQLPLGLSLTASAGIGAASLDARELSQDQNAPFAKIRAAEGGIIAREQLAGFDLSARAVAYLTHVDRELIFDPNLGRLSASTGTTRRGIVAAVRGTSRWLDEAASITTVDATFDEDRKLVPYTPLVIARSDTAVFGPLAGLTILGRPVSGSLGLGIGYIGKRALPFSQFASPTFQVDGSALLRVGAVRVGLRGTNLTDRQFPLSQFFYASDFRSRSYPTLAPAQHFTAAPPRTRLFTIELDLDREPD